MIFKGIRLITGPEHCEIVTTMWRVSALRLAIAVTLGISGITLAHAQGKTPVPATPLESARQTFEKFASFQANGDPRQAEFYADNAKVRRQTLYQDGQVRGKDTIGEKLKMQLSGAASMGKLPPDTEQSTFAKPIFEVTEDFVTVRVRRYSKTKCFNDDGYYQILGRRNDGAWLIVQELVTTIPVTYCGGVKK